MTNNPNAANPANVAGASGPFRLDRSQNLTADQGHVNTPEQQANHSGLMDMFPKAGTATSGPAIVNTKGLVMGYYDGNGDGALELCAVVRHERQLVRHHVRFFYAGRPKPDCRDSRTASWPR